MRLRDFLFGRDAVSDIEHSPVPAGEHGFGGPLHIAYQVIQPPTGDAGNKAVLQTYIVPRYSAIGTGIPNEKPVNSWPSSPVIFVNQTLLPTSLSPGPLSGGIYTQGTLDISQGGGGNITVAANPGVGSFSMPQRGLG